MRESRFQVVVAPDSFKGTLAAVEAAEAIARGFRRVFPDARVSCIPMADGGDGTVDAILAATGGRRVRCRVRDPLGRRVTAVLGVTPDGVAVVESARASGLVLLTPRERNPLRTSTRGTGELIRAALDRGLRRILVGIGGSATNDGGTGMARALGFRFLDARGRVIPEGGGALGRLASIDVSGADPRLRRTRIEVICDVRNRLTGPEGASAVYGPQKGATPAMVRELDRNLRRLAVVMKQDLGVDVLRLEGGGAAGGLGAGLVAFAGARLVPGVETVIRVTQLVRRLHGVDLVITGEGRTDSQTRYGKTPYGVAQAARRMGIPVLLLSGSLGPGAVKLVRPGGMTAVLSALERPLPEDLLRVEAAAMLERSAGQAARVLACGARIKKRVLPRAV